MVRARAEADDGPIRVVIVGGGAAGVITAAHLMRSADAGQTWRPLSRRAGLLAWPARRGPYLVDGTGLVWTTSDGGRGWEQIGDVGGAPAAFATHDDDLYVALHTNEVRVSSDGGRTWVTRIEP